jgi:glyoxylase-like metal-dependent hydrolase (beta-lactamase superfamily II)
VLQTHAHWDHIGATHHFDDVAVHPSEAEGLRRGYPPDRYRAQFTPELAEVSRLPGTFDPAIGIPGIEPTSWINHGDRFDLGGRELEVFHTPGHSPGGVTFLDRAARVLFVGDLLYFGAMYVFFPNSDPAAFRDSLRLATAISEEVDTVYPAHGPLPLVPEDVRAIRDAYEEVWSGRTPDRPGKLFGFDVVIHDFGLYSFLLAPDARLGVDRG